MIYIITALAGEAIPFINAFKLKKDISYTKFDMFKNEQIRLILSGTGKVKSAVATTYLLAKESPRAEDRIVNIGIAGSSKDEHKIGSVFLINKITDSSSGKSFYPETNFRHELKEERIVTFDRPARKNDLADSQEGLADMEASGFYEAAGNYFHSHRIHILKVISDHMRGEKLTGAFVQGLMERSIQSLKVLLARASKASVPDADVLNQGDYKVFDNVSNELNLSATQRFQVLDLIKGYKVKGGDDLNFIKGYVKQKKNTKQENKKIFEALKEKLEDLTED